MHDLHAADRILKLVLEKAQENKLQKVTKIVIELGKVVEHGQEILPENLKFNIRELARGTIAENARVQIRQVGNETWKLVEIEGE
jgi:Zn finger protein HypA/HybF involved in hydrogenase expression